MKKALVFIFAAVAMVVLPAISGSAEETALDISKLSEKERYILANAELACYSMSILGQRPADDADDATEAIVNKYGFTPEELEDLSEKYRGSESEVGMKSRKMCPEAWSGFRNFR